MEIRLDPMQGYVKNGKFDQKEALVSTGVKAAICYKEAMDGKPVTPEEVRRSESEVVLINRALNTIRDDHTTPSEHQMVSLEISYVPKILLMILNNEKQYTADERSLRYTEVEPNEYITDKEVDLYKKWLKKFDDIITEKYFEFYRKFSKSDKITAKQIHKLAQENARYMISVFMPTTTTYTVPWIQINKIMVYMKSIIDNPINRIEELLVPHFKKFIEECKRLDVALTKDSIYRAVSESEELKQGVLEKHPEVKDYKGDTNLLYNNNKSIELSLFASRNKFSGINANNEYGYTISYNNYESFACLAQEQRHRSIACEMLVLDEFKAFVPPIIEDDKKLVKEWISDIESVKEHFPQGQLVKVNRCMSIRSMLKYVSQERACDRAQLEIQRVYTKEIIPDVYEGLVNKGLDELASEVKPYTNKLRCGFPGYHCPGVCGHPRMNRDL